MSNNMKQNLVATTEVGRPQILSEKHTIMASFHVFESLPHEKRECTRSPEMSCHGHKWRIELYPGGDKKNEGDDGPFTSIFLHHKGPDRVKAEFSIRIGSKMKTSRRMHLFNRGSRGWHEFLLRSHVLDPTKAYLENGTLNIYVDIQVLTDTPVVWIPCKRLCRNMLESLESGNEGDVCFKVVDKRFVVYKGLIARSAPILGEIADSEPSGADISIHDVDPAIFGALLHFIYTDELPENMEYRAVLEVADRFNCSRLKLIAEAEIVKAGIDAENAAELLLFADAHSCALLREAALEFCITHPVAVKDSEGWEQLKESPYLLNELVGASAPQFSESDLDTMRVATLRQKLDEKGLEVDGTRETLIQRLKEQEAEN